MVVVTGESLLWTDGDHSYSASNERESNGDKRKQSFHGFTLSERHDKIAQRRISIS
jgi:hypothetical protein